MFLKCAILLLLVSPLYAQVTTSTTLATNATTTTTSANATNTTTTIIATTNAITTTTLGNTDTTTNPGATETVTTTTISTTTTTTTTTTTPVTTEEITTTTMDAFHTKCQAAKRAYVQNTCNCQIDQCLGEIFMELKKTVGQCPTCAREPIPVSITTFDWAPLFQGDPQTTPSTADNGTTTSTLVNGTTTITSMVNGTTTTTVTIIVNGTSVIGNGTTTTPFNGTTTTGNGTTTTTTPTTTTTINGTTTSTITTTVGNTTITTTTTTLNLNTTTSQATTPSGIDTNTTTTLQATSGGNGTSNTSTVGGNSSSTTTTTTTTETPYMCRFVPWGIKITDPVNYVGEFCCCNLTTFSGDEMLVSAVMLKTWKSSYGNARILETAELIKFTSVELELLVKQAFGSSLRSFKLTGIESTAGNLVQVDFVIFVLQSDANNSLLVQDMLTKTFQQYRDLNETQGIFGQTFQGYEKHTYTNVSASRNFTEDMYSGQELTTAPPIAAEDKNPYSGLYAFVPIGLLIIVGVCVFLCVRGDTCIPKAWVK